MNNVNQIFNQQKAFFKSNQTLPLLVRKKALKRLKETIQKHEEEVLQALSLDLGKSGSESYMSEIGLVYGEIGYMLRHMDGLARTKWAWTPLSLFGSCSKIVPIPYGTVLIVSPWNYPFQLSMIPLVDALAAGNTAMIKPSNYSVNTSAVIEKIILEAFDPQYVSCMLGNHELNQQLFSLPFNYMFFTGSPKVGKIVMENASKNLVPVTLELGGKSPCIVDESANTALAAQRIVSGKFLNAGQTCVAPDYILVHSSKKQALIQQLKHQIDKQYPNFAAIGKIINEKHFARLVHLMDPRKIIYGGKASHALLKIQPTIMDNVTWSDPIMQEEIFGPVLPIIEYENFEELMKELKNHPSPLATYLFSKDEDHIRYIEKAMPFGSGCINDTIVQLANDHLPFGGIGNSGMGQYHGKYGFETFSHDKSMLRNYLPKDLPLRYAPYSETRDFIIRLFMR